MQRIIGFLFVCALLASPGLAHAKDADGRIAELERQLAALQKTYMTNNEDTASAIARINTFQDEFAGLKGEAERNSHLIKAQREELMRLINDLQSRIQSIEDRMEIFSSQMTSAIGKVSPAAGSEAALYQKALNLADESKYLEAAAEFESFIQKYPKSPFVAKARGWVAECFYLSRDYKRAIKEFQIFIEKYPKDPKIPEAVLKQGNSFYELGLLDEARAFYEKVISSYSGSDAAKQAKTKIARIEERKGSAKSAGKTSIPNKTHESEAPASETSGSALSSYPTETIEQKRQKMGPPPPAAPAPSNSAKKDSVKEKKPGVPQKDF